jgi:arylsulfatase A-like enzyme
MGKQNLYQESIHVPFTIWSNRLPISGNCAKLCYLTDVYATALSIAGINQAKYDKDTSKNLISLLGDTKGRPNILFRFKSEIYSVISGGWKMIWYPKIKKYQLFNLMNDPLEKNNIPRENVPDIFKRLEDIIRDDF